MTLQMQEGLTLNVSDTLQLHRVQGIASLLEALDIVELALHVKVGPGVPQIAVGADEGRRLLHICGWPGRRVARRQHIAGWLGSRFGRLREHFRGRARPLSNVIWVGVHRGHANRDAGGSAGVMRFGLLRPGFSAGAPDMGASVGS